MSVQVRRRRESAAFLSSFVGAQGELLVDTTNNRVQVHDGATPGGFPAARLSEVLTNARTAVADTAYTALASDRSIAVTSLTAARTITLPGASAYPTGTQLLVFDESGACSGSNTITLAAAGTDTINGAASATISNAYGYLAFETNGTGKWTIVDQTASVPAATAARTSVADANYTALTTDRTIAYTALTAARTVTLPATSAFPTGTRLLVLDETGNASGTITIALSRAGSDTINGGTSALVTSAYGYVALQSNGGGKWTVVDQPGGSSGGTVAIANGGTGATSASAARANLGVAASGANSDITSLSGLTTALGIGQGGTGATSGPTALVALGAIGRTTVADTNYTALGGDRTVAFTSLTAARTITLPASSAYPTGTQLVIVDESGACSATNTITAARSGSDTINGATSAVLTLAYGYLALLTNGSGRWTIVDQSTASMAQQAANAVAITGGTLDSVAIGTTTSASGRFTLAGFGSTVGSAGTANKISLFGNTFGTGDIGFGVSPSSLDLNVNLTSSFYSYYYGGALKHRLGGTAGATYLLSLDSTPIGATTPSTVKGTVVTATTSVNLPSYTVATLPAAGTAGRMAYCSNARMFNGAGTQEASGSGTGGLVVDNGTAWKVAGTNVTAAA